MTDTSVMELPDGRELAWLELGDPAGAAVFGFHGTPGSRLQLTINPKAIDASRVRFIAIDRPGYGHSSYHRGRSLAGWADDVSVLADHLGIASFAVIGVSGGGPHAAACARFMGERVSAAGIVSGVGPLADREAEVGMLGANRVMSKLARRSPYLPLPLFATMTFVARRWPEAALRTAVKQLPAADAEVLSRPEVRDSFIEDSKRASSTAAMAAAQDFALFATDWGFELGDISVPVHVWHGDVDRNVPFGHGRLQAERIPGATFHQCPGEGHLLVVDHFEEILRTVSTV
jgi:pimeloyl-ACP methyl ester carboxylesterase